MQELISSLRSSSAYSHETSEIKTIITAVSIVFLTGNYAYKINKPLNLGFLDFSTLEKRKEQCEKEVRHNSLISPELYEGVATVNKNSESVISINGPGEIIEYAVKMKQINPEATMNKLLNSKNVSEQQIKKLAENIFKFHLVAPQNEEISVFGNVESIQFNWDENFSQTEKYKPGIIADEDFQFMKEKVNNFIQKNRNLLEGRINKNKIKHCHGDFHSSNVFIVDNKPLIFDGIVFNKRFPCSDIIAEIAFMAMDLDFHNQEDLSRLFVQNYLELSNDYDIPLLLNFYKCYRAYIRAKINCFTMEDTNLLEEDKQESIDNAEKYFRLARKYAELF